MISVPQLVFVLLAVNCAAFVAFWWDKRLAEAGARRISERTLLGLALVGGSLGAISAQQIFRHKTRKEPFRSLLYLIVLLQIVAGASWLLAPNSMTDLVRQLAS
ncbi:hypothetical protein ASD50_01920 [Mesorhizobium sp. Root552]|jgi:uncharacterized membrane protein YsdA (DUF1294 family)|uniref:DUF1294 domain-containing protein n=1 Tax=Mesorhizobium sp. Root552 TaxID=1736555 RepID=UPI0006FDCE2F|nr:DUF1294 domain-containing protein [Mesorhizobium sp. Root552]KQZ29534.1 hypothetical protein ASD50_01920 [Mesorhizobium sp. Root552]